MAHKATIPFAGFTIRRSLIYIASYSFGVPAVLFTPFLIAKSFNWPLAQQIGLTSQNVYTFLVFAGLIAAIITFLLLRRSLQRQGTSWRDLGIRRFPVFSSTVFIVLWPIVIVTVAVCIAVIASASGVEPSSSASKSPTQLTGGLVAALVIASLIAPVFEEVLFRGMLFSSLAKRYGYWIGLVASSLVFALMHLNPAQIATTLILGPYLCIIYRKLGSIIPGMILHSLHNAAVTLLIAVAL